MKLAILFWFYKDVDVCENRLQITKKYNPNLKIYGLYGGKIEEENIFRDRLWEYLDDFYMVNEKDSFRKWIHGDLFLLEWYQNRWKFLEGDSFVISQWDLLAFDSFENIFPWLQQDQIYLPNYGVVNELVENNWHWTSLEAFNKIALDHPERPHMRECFLQFREYVKYNYNFTDLLPYCIFMTGILPRIFFEKYGTIENIELGFLEYKIPTYAKIFWLHVYEKNLWETPDFNLIPQSPMNARPVEIASEYIHDELAKSDWRRVFHPYYKVYQS